MTTKVKQSLYQNLSFEELSYLELLEMGSLTPSNIIVNYNDPFIPRKIPSSFIHEINYFSPRYDGLLFCLCIDQILYSSGQKYSKRYYYSPSMTLFATLMRYDEDTLIKSLGKEDNLSGTELNKIYAIISEIKKKSPHIIRKRLQNILDVQQVVKLHYKGKAFNGLIQSKCDSSLIYEGYFKQLMFFVNNELKIYPFSQSRCSCGFNQASYLKYEYTEILARCSHIELIRQTLLNKNQGKNINIENYTLNYIPYIFSPFSPLDDLLSQNSNVRSIVRNALYNYIVPQPYIEINYDDSQNYHKSNGFTWFRCELDCFLLSFSEIFDPLFYLFWQSNINEKLSHEMTCKYFGDYIPSDLIIVKCSHEYNPLNQKIEHRINGKWVKIYHYTKIDEKFYPFSDDQIKHTSTGHEYSFDLIDSQLPIFHVIKKMTTIINYESPFQVAKVSGDILIYLTSYKMRKSK